MKLLNDSTVQQQVRDRVLRQWLDSLGILPALGERTVTVELCLVIRSDDCNTVPPSPSSSTRALEIPLRAAGFGQGTVNPPNQSLFASS